jgi:hypothetical protein
MARTFRRLLRRRAGVKGTDCGGIDYRELRIECEINMQPSGRSAIAECLGTRRGFRNVISTKRFVEFLARCRQAKVSAPVLDATRYRGIIPKTILKGDSYGSLSRYNDALSLRPAAARGHHRSGWFLGVQKSRLDCLKVFSACEASFDGATHRRELDRFGTLALVETAF